MIGRRGLMLGAVGVAVAPKREAAGLIFVKRWRWARHGLEKTTSVTFTLHDGTDFLMTQGEVRFVNGDEEGTVAGEGRVSLQPGRSEFEWHARRSGKAA